MCRVDFRAPHIVAERINDYFTSDNAYSVYLNTITSLINPIFAAGTIYMSNENKALRELGKYRFAQDGVGKAFERLCKIVDILRSDIGCPWDREQTPLTLRSSLLEETCELLESIDDADGDHTREEIGDVFLVLSLIANMHNGAQEHESAFMLSVLNDVSEKLLRRHPHVFGESVAADSSEVIQHWDRIKELEKGNHRTSRMDGVPHTYPPLLRAEKLQHRAAKDGFDWPNADGARSKIDEELAEIDELDGHETSAEKQEELEMEIGDLLFSVVNFARKHGISASIALARAARKFERRYRIMEQMASENGTELKGQHLDDLERYWEKSKGQ